jgi:hypothetical protein
VREARARDQADVAAADDRDVQECILPIPTYAVAEGGKFFRKRQCTLRALAFR